ncbi:MAG TPA: XRE family transcriptional regulator [Steroidobacter sp.]|uniref:helix-turn-helix domain-containing protein n=1 Tax=Steroidobacter sp. TaxID=1978227 RepID=UPI002ED81E30
MKTTKPAAKAETEQRTDRHADRPTLGRVLRALRTRNDWTLKEMSDRTGIPLSTLAKVEHDRLTLTYDKLLQLSERLKIRMSDLFAEPSEPTAQPVTARRSIGRMDRAIRVKTSNYDYYYLCAELRRKRMIPILTHIRAKSIEEFGDLVHHSGEEYIYVLSGRIEVHTEFYDPIVLEAGESLYIDSNMGHAYVAGEGCDEAIALGVCSSAEEDLMESLLELHGDDHVRLSRPTEPEGTPQSDKTKPRRKKSVA